MTHADGCPAAHNPRHGCACATPTVHAGPEDGSAVTPCCGRSPFELPRGDRMTYEPALVTCTTEPATGEVLVEINASTDDFLTQLRKTSREIDAGFSFGKGFLAGIVKGHADAVAECLVSDRERMEAQVAAYDRGRADEREAAAQRVIKQGVSIVAGRPPQEYIMLSLAVAAVRGDSDE
jgi:hypothetical protein